MHSTATGLVRLTPFQADEVSGLLDVCHDEVGMGTEGWKVWGTLDGLLLTVTDPADAAADLRQRADTVEHEGDRVDDGPRSRAQARSLRTLADRIEAAR